MPSLPDSGLSAEEREALLHLARQSVELAVGKSGNSPQVQNEGIFRRICGVFVTLHVQGKLRGCIGVPEGREPLGATIIHCATDAAVHDPRFSPVRQEELGDLEIEISLLSPLIPIDPGSILVGNHGLLIVEGRHRGLLLPQVALEHRLSREAFLEETCRKAGLRPDAWKSASAQIFVFTCEVFSDDPGAKISR